MEETVYAEHPSIYDALYDRIRDYALEVDFFETQFRLNGSTDGNRVLVVEIPGYAFGDGARFTVETNASASFPLQVGRPPVGRSRPGR